ncbi:MAG: tetratricopeptide repeat protein [Candidatus Thermoplasmatota archaeon]|nr:tetratricopeptide repeat protein [Candidatus Thermoplasmatota archaeon]
MKLGKEDLVLFSIYLISKDGKPDQNYRKDQLANALGISDSTLNLYMTRLRSDGLITRTKKKFAPDIRGTTDLTREGMRRVTQIDSMIDSMVLTEERHSIPSCIEVRTILRKINDIMERIFFLALYTQNKYFDLPMFLNTMKVSREDTTLLNIFSNIDANPCGTRHESFVETFFNASLYGEIDKDIVTSDIWRKEDIDALIILAEAKMRMGKFEDCSMILNHLLTDRTDLNYNQWFIIKIDQVHLLRKQNRDEEALSILNDMLMTVENRICLSLVKMNKGVILFFMGDREEYSELLRSAISSFSIHGLSLFLAMAYNVRGVTFFILERDDEAESDWLKARKYAREARSEFAEAKVMPNLADIAMKKGKFDLSKGYLKRAHEIFSSYNDYEGLAIVELNYALLYIEMRDLDKALEHFAKCKEVAFPLPTEKELVIFREEIIKRAREKGFEGVENII